MSENRLLILLNPGRQSRHYMLGLARAATRLGIPHACVEMEELWRVRDAEAQSRGMMGACVRVQLELARLVRKHRITHVIGYAWNGALDFGLLSREPGEPGEPMFAALGVRHIMLWTDHPDWFNQGAALRAEFVSRLDNPLHTHVLKSRAAAAEAAAALGWRNTVAMPMAEDIERFRIARAVDEPAPVHDVVAIMGGASALPPEIEPFLNDERPDPVAMDRAAMPAAMARWMRWVESLSASTRDADSLRAFGAELLRAKSREPRRSVWSLARALPVEHESALERLHVVPQRWYAAVGVLRRLGEWRRSFYPAWLARRLDFGLYGCTGAPIGIEQSAEATRWVAYEDQGAVYRRGRVALNINAAHDEEGLTHKPFQIASAGIACAHHSSAELDESFDNGREIVAFDRADGLLESIQRLLDDPRQASEMGHAMQARALREHTWDHRLVRMLQASNQPVESRVHAAAA